MSRTYRRKDYTPIWVTHKMVRMGYWWYERVAMEGKELEKSLARYHGDHDWNSSPTPSWRKIKAQEKQELIRWMKNPDHEVQMHEHPRWPWWD